MRSICCSSLEISFRGDESELVVSKGVSWDVEDC